VTAQCEALLSEDLLPLVACADPVAFVQKAFGFLGRG